MTGKTKKLIKPVKDWPCEECALKEVDIEELQERIVELEEEIEELRNLLNE